MVAMKAICASAFAGRAGRSLIDFSVLDTDPVSILYPSLPLTNNAQNKTA
jgi:hypothetical protein